MNDSDLQVLIEQAAAASEGEVVTRALSRDVALRAGLPIYGLQPRKADPEALFFELTEGTNRNEALGGGAPAERDAVTGQEGANL